MNQEKIMKVKMIVSMIICFFALAAMCVFIALFLDEKEKVQRTYKEKYTENLTYACEEIDMYIIFKLLSLITLFKPFIILLIAVTLSCLTAEPG